MKIRSFFLLLCVNIVAMYAHDSLAISIGDAATPSNETQRIVVGDVTIQAMVMGHFEARLADLVQVPEHERSEDYSSVFERRLPIAFRTILIDTGSVRVLVDPCRTDWMVGTKFDGPTCRPGRDLSERLEDLGVDRGTISHVVMTHYHQDHASGFTFKQNDRWMPLFQKAKHYLGRGDWEYRSVRNALAEPNSRIARTVGVVRREGLLQLVDQPLDISPEIRLIPAPGETPGHMIVRVQSAGETFFYVGDLYHAPVEVQHPDWMASWNAPKENRRSRKTFTEAALKDDALVLGSHIPLARIQHNDGVVSWCETREKHQKVPRGTR